MTDGASSTKNIYITSENGVQINISTSEYLISSLKSQIDRVVEIPSNEHIIVPAEMELTSFKIETKAILIETSDDVFVITHIDGDASVGSTTQIPIHKLSTKFVVITGPVIYSKNKIAVAAIEDNTTIAITLKMWHRINITMNGKIYQNNDVFNITLNRLETYQIEHNTDFTGSVIDSSKPIAAFSGTACKKLESVTTCEYFFEQLPPVVSLDREYIVPPNPYDSETGVVITAVNNTNLTYFIDPTQSDAFLLNEYTSIGTLISSNQPCVVQSENPVLVTAFGLHYTSSELGVSSVTVVPGIHQYLDYYKIVVPTGYDHNYVSIMIKYAAIDSFRINGTTMNRYPVTFEDNVTVGNIKYYVRTLQVTDGELTASTVDGERFGLMVTGGTNHEAYGFSGNYALINKQGY